MFEKIRKILNYRLDQGDDSKPAAFASFLMRDDCSRLLGEFSGKHLVDCEKLVLIWKNAAGDVQVLSSESTDNVSVIGLLYVAQGLVSENLEGNLK